MRHLLWAVLAVAMSTLPLAQPAQTLALGPDDLPAHRIEWTDGGGLVWQSLRGDRLAEGRTGTPPARIAAPARVDVTFVGSASFDFVFAVCGGALVASQLAVEGVQSLEVPEGACEIGGYRPLNGTLVIRAVVASAAAPAAVALNLSTDPEHTVDVTLRDETGAAPPFGPYVQRFVMLSRPGDRPGAGFSTNILGIIPPQEATRFRFRYSVPDGLGYRLDWSVRSWATDVTRYHFKGRVDTDQKGRTVEAGGDALATLRVRHRPPTGTGPLRMPLTTWSMYDRDGIGPLWSRVIWHICEADLLAAPFEQTRVEMADPAADFFVRENVVTTTFDSANDMWAPADPSAFPCDVVPDEEYVGVGAPIRRDADGTFRAYRANVGYGPGVPLGDAVASAVAPLAFVARLDELGNGPRLIQPESPYHGPFHWPGEGVLRGPLAVAQAGDARPARMRYEVHDADGALLASGADAQELFGGVLPAVYPATFIGELADFGVRVGVSPVAVRVRLDYGAAPSDRGVPYLQQLTVEDGAGPTDTVGPGGQLHIAVGDDASGVASLAVDVRRAESDRPWEPLALTTSETGRATANIGTLGDGAYALRVRTTDVAGNASVIESDPAFRVSGAVASEHEPGGGLRLHAPRPNPTAGHTRLAFALAAPADIDLAVFDALGRRVATVATGPHGAGAHAIDAETAGLATGVYLVRLHVGDAVATRPLGVIR